MAAWPREGHVSVIMALGSETSSANRPADSDLTSNQNIKFSWIMAGSETGQMRIISHRASPCPGSSERVRLYVSLLISPPWQALGTERSTSEDRSTR